LDWLGWQSTFLALAGLVFLNTLPVLFYSEPQYESKDTFNKANTQSFTQAIKAYLNYFQSSQELKVWLLVLISFKVADGLAGPLLKPLMVDMGLNFTQIGVFITMFGAVAALLGAGIAGLLLKHYSRVHCLIVFSLLKIMSLGGYTVLAYHYEAQNHITPIWLYVVNALEDVFSAMLLVVMLTLVMQYSRKKFAATDFTFQVSIMATVSGLLYLFSGVIGDWLGYYRYLIAICIVSMLCLLPIYYWKNKAR